MAVWLAVLKMTLTHLFPLEFAAFPQHQDPLPLGSLSSGILSCYFILTVHHNVNSVAALKQRDHNFQHKCTLSFILFICKTHQVFSSPAFSQMMISFFYGGKLMQNILVSHPEGCRISPQQHLSRGTLYSSDSMQSVHFPPAEQIEYERQQQVTRKLLGHLERGVLVRANQEGIFIKRLCQSRVFWSGLGEAGSQYSSVPCKLERDAVVKIFDTGRFLQGKLLCLFKISTMQMVSCHTPPPPPSLYALDIST